MKKFLSYIFVAVTFSITAQQDYQFTQYMSNFTYLNPAYVGTKDFASATGLFRRQWVKFNGAPSTAAVMVESPLSSKNMGVGGLISFDEIGVSRQLNFSLDYSYQLKFEKSKLSLGLNAGFMQYSARLSELTVWDEQDAVFANDYNGKLIPQFGFGTYYYSDKYFVGVSIPRITNVNTDQRFNINLNNAPSFNRHYYLMGGYNFSIADDMILKSSTLIKYTGGAPLQIELSAIGFYKELYGLGVSYRTDDCISPILQYKIKDFGMVGYSYDVTISKMRGYSSGSHEIMLTYQFKQKAADKASFD